MILYQKIHNDTGLKYLGMTRQDDPFTYNGSGTYWKKHLKKHGANVSTKILFESDDKEKFQEVCLKYSERFDVVESKEWANLRPETGEDGCVKGTKFSKEHKRKIAKASSKQLKKQWEDPEFRKAVIERASKQISEINKQRWETDTEYVKHMSNRMKEMNSKTKVCPHCNKVSNIGNYNRWHGDNCKGRN